MNARMRKAIKLLDLKLKGLRGYLGTRLGNDRKGQCIFVDIRNAGSNLKLPASFEGFSVVVRSIESGNPIVKLDDQNQYKVSSFTNPGHAYIVDKINDRWICSCPAYEFGRGKICKHIRTILTKLKK